MAAHMRTHFPCGGNAVGSCQNDFEFFLIHLSHELDIEGAGTGGGITIADVFADGFGAPEVNFPSASRPDQEFHNPLHIAQRVGIDLGLYDRIKT